MVLAQRCGFPRKVGSLETKHVTNKLVKSCWSTYITCCKQNSLSMSAASHVDKPEFLHNFE